MSMTVKSPLNRRHFLMGAAACVGAPAMAQDLNSASTIEMEQDISSKVRRNVSAFRSLDWQPYFSNLNNGAVLVDIDSRALHFWTEAGEYFLFPSSVPMSEELTRRGRTSVVRKVEGPEWRPTPSMLERNPDWPTYVGPGPDNPLGTHALYLSWTYYRIHGTHDTRKIGRQSSDGCIGLYNHMIEALYQIAPIGTQVRIV